MPLPERALIAQIRRLVQTAGRRQGYRACPEPVAGRVGLTQIRLGIGDDCAVLRLPRGYDSLVTIDFSLEGIHFRREWHTPETVGHRCLARGLSDIAAMGGEPVAAFLSLALPRDVPQSWVNRFLRGLARLAQRYGVALAGGDTAESPGAILADIVVVGSVPKGAEIRRAGAHPGDRIYVSGELGGSAAAIAELRAHPKKKLRSRDYPRHFAPEPRLALGRVLRAKRLATAMIDTSDGLSTDLAHICEASGVGAEVAAAGIPRARVGQPSRDVDLEFALHGGEDYELLFTSAGRVPALLAGVPLTCIGRITRVRKMIIRDANGVARNLVPHGWEHFRELTVNLALLSS